MIGRTPEYLGKKIETFDMKMAAVAILVPPIVVLAGTAIAVGADAGRAGIANPGRARLLGDPLRLQLGRQQQRQRLRRPVGEHAVLQHRCSAIAMLFGRFWLIVPVLAIAGSLAAKKRVPVTAGTLPTHGPLFVVLLIGSVLLVGVLNFVPALALGPVVEHLMLFAAEVSAMAIHPHRVLAVRPGARPPGDPSTRSSSSTRASSGAIR